MMTSHTDSTTVAATRRLAQPYVAAILALAGAGMLAAGIWAGAAPRSFARFVNSPRRRQGRAPGERLPGRRSAA
jgi:hypothetical protein